MNKTSANKRSIMLKAVSTALILILSGSLFAAGAMGSDGCGMTCCCQNSPTRTQFAAEKQMRSPMGCCSGVPLSPCDLQSSRPIELPDIISATCCIDLPNTGAPTGLSTVSNVLGQNLNGNLISQQQEPAFISPPLFLQNLSFLI